jgi:hypothetical protein
VKPGLQLAFSVVAVPGGHVEFELLEFELLPPHAAAAKMSGNDRFKDICVAPREKGARRRAATKKSLQA